jgi:thioredoxin reductase (NADPH)
MPADVQRDRPPKLTLYGRAASPAAYAIRDFLTRSDVPFEWIELRSSEQARQIGIENLHDNRLPVCVFPDGARMENPLAAARGAVIGFRSSLG